MEDHLLHRLVFQERVIFQNLCLTSDAAVYILCRLEKERYAFAGLIIRLA